MHKTRINNDISAEVDREVLLINQTWKQFARMPMIFIVFFTCMFIYSGFRPAGPSGSLDPMAVFYNSRYAFFLIWGLFGPAILLFLFSRTEVTLEKNNLVCRNVLIHSIKYNRFVLPSDSIRSFAVRSISKGRTPLYYVNVIQKNGTATLVPKLLDVETSQKISSMLEKHLAIILPR